MLRRALTATMAAICALLLALPATASLTVRPSEDTIAYGFSYDNSYTNTANMYTFYPDYAFTLYSKEVDLSPYYQYLDPGTEVYLPIFVAPDGGDDIPATEKNMKNDNVSVSYKILNGAEYVGEIVTEDIKRLKLKDVENGVYVKIPLAANYDLISATQIHIKLKISVNNVTYDYTEITFRARVRNETVEITHNSIYGARNPSLFKGRRYSGEASFDLGENVVYHGGINSDSTYFLSLSREPSADLSAMYPDTWLDYYTFLGDRKTFTKIGTLVIPVNRANLARRGETPELYVYRVDGLSLTALGAGVVSFDTNNNRLFIRAKPRESYVLSIKALLKEITPDSSGNVLRSGYAV
jgi:hypothetical protein